MKTIVRLLIGIALVGLAACGSRTTPMPPRSTELPPPSITTIPLETFTPTAPVGESLAISQYSLAGHAILIQYEPDGNRLIELDLATGNIRILFQSPKTSWLAAAAVSPDLKKILLAYAPPVVSGETQFGFSDLYLLDYDGVSQPKPFILRFAPPESYFLPAWAPDGQSVYFTHLYQIMLDNNITAYQNAIEMAALDGQPKLVIDSALWPVLSPDGSRLAYLYVDPMTFGNDLYLSNPDGSDPKPMLEGAGNPPVDAHLFTSDGSQLIFSMVNPMEAPPSAWWDRFFGIMTVSAHSVPSDWYRVPVSGGSPARVTNLNDIALNGDLSPSGDQMVFVSATGLFSMNIDGSNLIQLTRQSMIGTVDWVP